MATDLQFPEPVAPVKKGMLKEDVKKLFTAMTWNPTVPQMETIEGLRKECYRLAGLITVNTQPCPEQVIAVRRIWEAFEYAKLAIILDVEVF